MPTDLTIKIDHVTLVPIIQKLPPFPLSLHRCHLTGHQTSVREPTAGAKTELGNERTENLSAKTELGTELVAVRCQFLDVDLGLKSLLSMIAC